MQCFASSGERPHSGLTRSTAIILSLPIIYIATPCPFSEQTCSVRTAFRLSVSSVYPFGTIYTVQPKSFAHRQVCEVVRQVSSAVSPRSTPKAPTYTYSAHGGSSLWGTHTEKRMAIHSARVCTYVPQWTHHSSKVAIHLSQWTTHIVRMGMHSPPLCTHARDVD